MRLFLMSLLALGLWGIWALAGKLALERGMPPRSIFLFETAAGFVMGGLVVLGGALLSEPAPWVRPWNYYGLLSGSALALGLLAYYLALDVGSLSVVVTVTSLYPVVAVALAVALLGERPSKLQWLAIALALTSLVILIIEEQRVHSERAPESGLTELETQEKGPS